MGSRVGGNLVLQMRKLSFRESMCCTCWPWNWKPGIWVSGQVYFSILFQNKIISVSILKRKLLTYFLQGAAKWNSLRGCLDFDWCLYSRFFFLKNNTLTWSLYFKQFSNLTLILVGYKLLKYISSPKMELYLPGVPHQQVQLSSS